MRFWGLLIVLAGVSLLIWATYNGLIRPWIDLVHVLKGEGKVLKILLDIGNGIFYAIVGRVVLGLGLTVITENKE